MLVLSCGVMFMGNQGPFLHRHVKVADLQNHFQMCCFLRIAVVLFFLFWPIAAELLFPKQLQGYCVVIQEEY